MDKIIQDEISSAWCKSHKIAFLNEGGSCRALMENDCDELLLEKLRTELGARIFPEKASLAEINRMNRSRQKKDSVDYLQATAKARESSWESEPIINLVDSLLEQALEKRSTDIHIEPMEQNLRIRLRLDGLLENFRELPLWLAEPILVRLKVLAHVDITDRRIPHDGSFTFSSSMGMVNIRLSTLPIQGGEKCVLRLLPRQSNFSNAMDLSQLIQSKSQQEFLKKVFCSPQGLFLVTGPTGSGKSTTLHAGLKQIIQNQVNVTTIEDPVEYRLEGANQVQVNEKCGFTFPVALRSILRQDPDVILVGEIRDSETAKIAIRAAQTGHLVLSTLHTNSSKAAIQRLEDLGIEKSALQDSLLGIMAQRLARRKDPLTGIYSGRLAISEILKCDGSFVDGTLQDSARRVIDWGLTDEIEIRRILGYRD